jgi:hypothetical protein
LTKDLAPSTFHIGIDDVTKCVNETIQLIKDNKIFAILMPVSVTSEIARLENVDGQRCHDKELALKIKAMSKITLASSSEVWLINLPGEPFNHFLSNDMEGLGLTGCQEVFQESIARERQASTIRRKHYKKTRRVRLWRSSYTGGIFYNKNATSRGYQCINTGSKQYYNRRTGY